MKQTGIMLAMLALFMSPRTLALAGDTTVQPVKTSVNEPAHRPEPAYMRVFGQSSPPIGYVQFCERLPADCEIIAGSERRVELTPQRLSDLDRVNRMVNRDIKPATDWELYGVEEYWTYPDARKRGDCEDYVLLKRKILIEQGWPQGALLITVVRDERKEGHAILTVRSAQGDFVLDNKNDDIRAWHRTPYQFVMRQSYFNPKVWVSLEVTETNPSAAVAGVRRDR